MSNRHLPAGQSIHQGGPGGVPGADMGGAPGGGPRRRQPQYMPQYHQQQQQQHMGPMYPNYVPYAPQGYYGMPPQFQNGGMPSPGYMPYQNYARSPPSMHQYVPMVGVSVPPNYPRPAQHSPSLSTPYQPPAPAPIPPQTPSSTHSSQMLPPPTPPTPQIIEQPMPAPPPAAAVAPQLDSSPIVERQPFRPPLPWLSRPDVDFPTRAPRSRRRRKPLNADSAAVSLPTEQHGAAAEQVTPASVAPPHAASGDQPKGPSSDAKPAPSAPMAGSVQQPEAAVAASETAAHSDGRSPSSAVPVIPALPRPTSKTSSTDKAHEVSQTTDAGDKPAVNGAEPAEAEATDDATVNPPVKAAPTSWANLFAKPSAKGAVNSAGPNGTGALLNGGSSDAASAVSSSAFSKANANSLAEAIHAYRVDSGDKISFLEPRGLINTGNMCYMNSVLQVLMFCVPFYDFLEQVSKRAVHSFKSDTPLVDAMIMFMHEYKVLASGASADQLRRILKGEDLEKYGEPFTPEFVYEAIRQLSRFASMRRGHQQDAEEFLGFLLQSLDDECTHVMSHAQSNDSETGSVDLAASQSSADPGDWLEVGRKQRAAVTRSSGSNSSTPINKIFGGLLRSEFRVPGLKDSITTEPYQPLQLDIGSPDVRNVVDALRGLTRPERLQGDFNSPRGKDVMATKQVFIESLPPVLILHLKRFQFDAEGHGTIKIWKKIGYPLELEIPREALSRQKRQTMGEGAMPKYKLISVVYHHGKNASGGHYTVDVRRQDGREWIRMDDTVLRRVRSEDVAEGGSEEEVKEVRKENPAAGPSLANRFGAINDEDTGDEDGWKQVTASAGGNKRWSSVVNGTSNGAAREKQVKESIKDNKVAYLLFYQRV
ncbi:Putative ubiquitin carboxyl-terminal hydrolase 3 [Tolypocladium paradoxum]|uniref:Ubiquitin carboxyl-terminal hydrolase n=1 Tax=Tolypocladium paradoxum TaxID=94208 RepID=A0A2S4LA28_9HYPO|nr:Putative ubiquitin carboxyl-terminal hydrolase 3 [Tolypocladium paradoxum]